jgi:purine-binding chemotaxis protein CheW
MIAEPVEAPENSRARHFFLLAQSQTVYVALPLNRVIETMRPRPVQPLRVEGLPEFVSGVAIVRGAAVPVIDVGQLVHGVPTHAASRFITVPADDAHLVALAVEGTPRIVEIESEILNELPSLLGATRDSSLKYLGRYGHQLLVTLRTSHLIAPEVGARIRSLSEAVE